MKKIKSSDFLLGLTSPLTINQHDGCAAIVSHGKTLSCCEEERYTRDKHALGKLPVNAISAYVFGCTDPIATNYDTEATFDYGCEYNSNYVLEFDGIDDYVVLNTAIDDNLESGATFSAWVKIEEPASDGALTILSNYASGGPGDPDRHFRQFGGAQLFRSRAWFHS